MKRIPEEKAIAEITDARRFIYLVMIKEANDA